MLLLLAALAACGGGGGGGDDSGTAAANGGGGTGPLVYAGKSAAAVINVSSANALLRNAFGSDAATAAASGVAADPPNGPQGHVGLVRELAGTVRSALPSSEERSRAASLPVDETNQCPGGGTRRTAGDMSPAGTGTVTATFTNCKDGEGDLLDGTATIRIDAYNAALSMLTDYTITIARLALRGGSNIDLSGSIRIQANADTDTETRTANLIVLEVATGAITKIENFVVADTYDNILGPSSYTESITGRAYDPTHGFVDVTTPAKLVFRSVNDEFPSSGRLVLVGAAGSRVAITARETVAEIALDADGNGVFERQARLNWNDVGGPAGANLSDTDGDGMHDSWESVYGLDPAAQDQNGDLDGDGSTNLAEYLAGTRPNAR
jgi:hypothetical protein